MADNEKFRTNDEKFEMFKSITVKEVIDYLDGKIVLYRRTEANLGSIDGRYCSGKQHYAVFQSAKHGKVNLSNGWNLAKDKPFYEEFNSRIGAYWQGVILTKNAIKKCSSKDEMLKMIVTRCAKFLHYHIGGYSYINIIKVLIGKGSDFHSKDRSGELKNVQRRISELEKELAKLKERKNIIEAHQKIYNDLWWTGQNNNN